MGFLLVVGKGSWIVIQLIEGVGLRMEDCTLLLDQESCFFDSLLDFQGREVLLATLPCAFLIQFEPRLQELHGEGKTAEDSNEQLPLTCSGKQAREESVVHLHGLLRKTQEWQSGNKLDELSAQQFIPSLRHCALDEAEDLVKCRTEHVILLGNRCWDILVQHLLALVLYPLVCVTQSLRHVLSEVHVHGIGKALLEHGGLLVELTLMPGLEVSRVRPCSITCSTRFEREILQVSLMQFGQPLLIDVRAQTLHCA